MTTFISKEKAEELMKIKGEVRGLGIKDDFLYIKKELGEEAAEKVERSINRLGYDFDSKKIINLGFYPVGLEALGLAASHKILGMSEDQIRKMGAYEAKHSIIVRLFMKYFVSVDRLAAKASEMWSKYYTVGELSVLELDARKKKGVIVLKDFKLHPLHCRVLEGYFASVLEMVVKEKVRCKEVECLFEGGAEHKFDLKW